jgi:hypothetical protein
MRKLLFLLPLILISGCSAINIIHVDDKNFRNDPQKEFNVDRRVLNRVK